jgi:hypothetical protein
MYVHPPQRDVRLAQAPAATTPSCVSMVRRGSLGSPCPNGAQLSRRWSQFVARRADRASRLSTTQRTPPPGENKSRRPFLGGRPSVTCFAIGSREPVRTTSDGRGTRTTAKIPGTNIRTHEFFGAGRRWKASPHAASAQEESGNERGCLRGCSPLVLIPVVLLALIALDVTQIMTLERVSKPSRSCLDRVRGTIDRLSGGRRSQWADAPDERSSGFETSS